MEKLILKAGKYNTKDENRTKITMLSAIYGLMFNILLAAFKVVLSIITNSVSILGDAINNITDCLSSVVTFVGAKLSHMPPDKEHPYGHGRIEYISALFVSVSVLFIGLQFMKVSFDRIRNPVPIEFDLVSIIIMTVSILAKLYMTFFYSRVSKKINSMPIDAQSKDSLSDVVITSVVVASMIVYNMFNVHIDGYVGFLVSLVVIHSGYELIRDTFAELIGKVPDELIGDIEKKVLNYDNILGVHDIIAVNFGPDKAYINMDVEVPYNMSLVEAHNLVDKIEKDIETEHDLNVSIHVDPVGSYNKEEREVVNLMKKVVRESDKLISFHDIYLEDDLVHIDVVVDAQKIEKAESVQDFKNYVEDTIEKELGKKSEITVDRYFK
ncbi:cation diffusion facilitator family transporter [Peptoniphilus catoniae]|uniref:cation diffusion facilitator family transporter n=1 Tax=Peptoniphilus catoniae TaxID=1660341 RepID=UPI0010FDF9CD|nr:cation diffusion facilitator family transporter [Peptoniphilus catoniae]